MPINITMPALSPTMTHGTLSRWLKKEGDAIKAGDVLAEIETDKATMEVEAVDEGTLGKIVIPEGTENVAVNAVIAVLLEEGEKLPAVIPSEGRKPAAEGFAPDNQKPKNADPSASDLRSYARDDKKEGDRIYASPLAKRIAKEQGIDLATVKGSGPRGRIVQADLDRNLSRAGRGALPLPQGEGRGEGVRSTIDAKKLADAYGMAYTEILNNAVRKIVASRLLESKQTVPHFYLTIECVIDHLLAARKTLNDQAAGAFKLSVNDFVIKAAAMALKAYPPANVAWTDAAILQFKHADISVAVATPNGLITPIIKQAEEKGLRQISQEMKDLAARARDGKLKPQEFQGGTFSISNLGMYGIESFGAIINPPQACILAIGSGIEKPVVQNGKIEIRTVMACTLSVDHRAVDGAVGAEFLQIFKKFIEDPVNMLV